MPPGTSQGATCSWRSVRGGRKFIRDITLITRKDKQQLEQIEADRARLQTVEARKRDAQESNQSSQRQMRVAEEMKKSQLLERRLQKAQERR